MSGFRFFKILCRHFFSSICYHAYRGRSAFSESHIEKQGKSLQEYINENSLSSKDLGQLKKREYKQHLILLEIYSEGKCLYSSFYDIRDPGGDDITIPPGIRSTISLFRWQIWRS